MKLVWFTIESPGWNSILIMRPLPQRENPWGDLEVIRETPWGALLPVVSGDALSHALHGHTKRLMAQIGTPPAGLCKKIQDPYRTCGMIKTCLAASEKNCQPGPKLPDCYDPPSVAPEMKEAITAIALAWKEGRYVIIVEGDEFSL